MKTFTVIQGDDEEFALLILDPITGDPVDLRSISFRKLHDGL